MGVCVKHQFDLDGSLFDIAASSNFIHISSRSSQGKMNKKRHIVQMVMDKITVHLDIEMIQASCSSYVRNLIKSYEIRIPTQIQNNIHSKRSTMPKNSLIVFINQDENRRTYHSVKAMKSDPGPP